MVGENRVEHVDTVLGPDLPSVETASELEETLVLPENDPYSFVLGAVVEARWARQLRIADRSWASAMASARSTATVATRPSSIRSGCST